jgi:hypothetical protein
MGLTIKTKSSSTSRTGMRVNKKLKLKKQSKSPLSQLKWFRVSQMSSLIKKTSIATQSLTGQKIKLLKTRSHRNPKKDNPQMNETLYK